MTSNPLYIMVCSRCLRASCWHGHNPCDDAVSGGVIVKPVDELATLAREPAEHWSAPSLRRVYGHVPNFSEALPTGRAAA